ncbi:MAG TPA: hypothetical protein VFV23_02215 [Verrucomicrobiae bacterium]|nr:hypothetical protein [Verrucomicrobiae bacterium]
MKQSSQHTDTAKRKRGSGSLPKRTRPAPSKLAEKIEFQMRNGM